MLTDLLGKIAPMTTTNASAQGRQQIVFPASEQLSRSFKQTPASKSQGKPGKSFKKPNLSLTVEPPRPVAASRSGQASPVDR